jgi:hypothetical protein
MCFLGPLGYGQDNPDFDSRQGQEISPELPDRLWSPPGFLVNGYEELCPQQCFEADLSPPSIAKVRNGGTVPVVHICASRHVWGNFTFYKSMLLVCVLKHLIPILISTCVLNVSGIPFSFSL